MVGDRSYEKFAEKADTAYRQSPEGTTSDEECAYQEEYGILLNWFGTRKREADWNADLVRLAGLAVYGWMPRMLRVYGKEAGSNGIDSKDDFQPIADALNHNKWNDVAGNFLNRSYVGTSKFLHFAWPDEYAIWDSNVHKALDWPSVTNSKLNFETYQRHMRKFCSDMKKSLREVEVALFREGKKLKVAEAAQKRSSELR